MSATVIIYTSNYCPYCIRAKELLKNKGIEFSEISIENDDEQRMIMMQKSGRRTVPQIFINDQTIGGFDDLYALEQKGELDALLNQ